jgi:hypothetical protein
LAKVERYISQLDALGRVAAPERMLAHRSLAQSARLKGSVSLWDRELTAALAASHELTGDTSREYAFESAKVWRDIAELKARNNDAPGAILAIETARKELVPLRPGVADDLSEQAYTMMGRAVAPVQATRWFNSNDSINTIHPIPGKPALLFFINPGEYANSSDVSILHRLKTKFATKGLDIVLMTRTRGFYGTQLYSPDSEVVLIGEYFAKYGRRVGTLAVWKTDMGRRYDGRLTVLSSPNEERLRGGSLFIVDPSGRLRLVSFLSPYNETMLEDVIGSLL